MIFNRPDMPIFSRKKTTEDKRLLEHKLYLAKERPDELFDLSACGLKEIPDGTFSFIKVLRKTHLLLQNNAIRTLDGGGKLGDLHLLHELNLSCNEIRSLPSEFELLVSLKVLLLADNRIQTFPDPILRLKHLHTLNLEGNQIETVPVELEQMIGLVQLHLDRNPITSLPKELSRLEHLQSITLPVNNMTTPPSDVCANGTQAILRYLGKPNPSSSQSDESDGSRRINEPPESTQSQIVRTNSLPPDGRSHEVMVNSLTNQRSRAQEFERNLQEAHEAHFRLAQQAQEARKQVLHRVTEEDAQLNLNLTAVQQRRDRERAAFLSSLIDAEQSAYRLIQQLLADHAKVKFVEAAEELASRRLLDKPDASFKLRREEVLAEMKHILELEDEVYHDHTKQRDAVTQRTLHMGNSDSDHVDRVLARRYEDRKKLAQELASKEEAQRVAFTKLFAQQDSQAQRLKREIGLIEQELCRLTMAEQDRKAKRTEVNQRTLAERRKELLDLLIQLNKDHKRRQNELQQLLVEIENGKQQDQLDYWLIQYQRLLDTKPPELSNELDDEVWHVLKAADALDYLPNFRYHRITGSMLHQLTDEKLQQIGVRVAGPRLAILNQLTERLTEQKKFSETSNPMAQATAPPPALPEEERLICPTAPPDLTAHVENECCVCQNSICTIVFLQCAHVCTCETCAQRLTMCPLCRAPILQRIQLQYY